MNKKQVFGFLLIISLLALTACTPFLLQVTLEVAVVGQGTVLPGPGSHTYNQGESIALSAFPAEGWKFDSWSGAVNSTQSTTTLIMDGNKTVLAKFVEDTATTTYTLTTTVQGQGQVTKTPDQATYTAGTQVQLQAQPAAGWVFKEWNGDFTGGANPATISMDKSYTITAVFEEQIVNQYSISLTIQGKGEVTKTPDQAAYTANSTVELLATPTNGWVFKEWLGDVTGGANPITVTMNANKNVTAVFEEQTIAGYKWNFLVYLDADNDLEPFGIKDINEMEKIGSTDDVNIMVLMDRSPYYDISNGDWAGTRLYRIVKDTANTNTIISELVEDYGELDMSNPQTLTDFIVFCQQNYPAERTVVTLWDHGSGVAPKSIFPTRGFEDESIVTPQGICWDDTTGDDFWSCLTTDEVATAFANARAATGQKLDIVNMDACLMQMIEIVYEWRQEVDYLVGSQETVPGDGNDYASVLSALTVTPSMTTVDAAKMLVDKFYSYYYTYGEGFETYSVMALGTGFNTLITAFQSFATALKNTADMEAVYYAWNNTMYFTSPENRDLYQFAGQLLSFSSDNTVKAAATALRNAFAQAVIYHKETQNYVGSACGLSVFIASASEWSYYSGQNQYTSLKLSQDSDWDDFILNFVNFTGGTGGEYAPEILSMSITWSNGDCDLGVLEPDGYEYWSGDYTATSNGAFTGDMQNGGTESWVILKNHTPGDYTFGMYSYSYTGYITVDCIYNSQTASATSYITPSQLLTIETFTVQSIGGLPTLQLNIEKQDGVMQKPVK